MNQLAVAIAIVLFPGLIVSVICDKVTVHNTRWDAFKYAIYSFLFGLICFTLLQGIVIALAQADRLLPGLPWTKDGSLSAWSLVYDEKFKVNLAEVVWATLLAPLIAAAAAATVNLKLVNRIAQWLGISRKYGDENLFSFFLNTNELEWVYVRDKSTGLAYSGKVVSFSECEGAQEIVLSEVEVFEYESSEKLYGVSYIYLAKQMGNFVIEVPNEIGATDDAEEAFNRGANARGDQDAVDVGYSGRSEEGDPRHSTAPSPTH
jgi:hypothetical protein